MRIIKIESKGFPENCDLQCQNAGTLSSNNTLEHLRTFSGSGSGEEEMGLKQNFQLNTEKGATVSDWHGPHGDHCCVPKFYHFDVADHNSSEPFNFHF